MLEMESCSWQGTCIEQASDSLRETKIKLTVNQWKTLALGFWDHLWPERSLHLVPGTEDSDRTRGKRHKPKHMKFHPNRRKVLYCEGAEGLVSVGQKGVEVSVTGGTQNSTGHDPGKPAPAEFA